MGNIFYKTILPLLVGLTIASAKRSDYQIIYRLSMPEPHTHYFQVEMEIQGNSDSLVVLKMPVWTPGSYLVREFSRNIPKVTAFADRRELIVKKKDKNSWEIDVGDSDEFTVNYQVYAYEQSVRTSFLNTSRGYIIGASVFLYIDGHRDQSGELRIDLYKKWHTVSTGLSKIAGKRYTYQFENYDILVDSPILMGNHKVLKFTVDKIPHEIALYGKGSINEKKFIADVKKIAETTRDIFGDFPYNRYVFIILLLDHASGGLEHLNSTSIQVDRWIFSDDEKYKKFISTVAHEFFHTWNVKRIRPIALGPFEYSKENYTEDLWIAEGITSYYDLIILLRSGIFSDDEFFEFLAKEIKSVETTPGRKIQSLTEASFDAWIKSYRRDENSPNTQISYYSKGAVIGLILDLAIIENTFGEKSLDNVFQMIYADFVEEKDRGFTSEEFRDVCESVAGRSLSDIWWYVDGTDEINYDDRFHPFGYQLEKSYSEGKSDSTAYFGFEFTSANGNPIVRRVYSDTPAYKRGLNANDEILAVEDARVNEQLLKERLKDSLIGEPVTFLISREGLIQTVEITPEAPPFDTFSFEKVDDASENQKFFSEKWLRVPWKE